MADDPSEPALSDSGCTGQALVLQREGELSSAVEAAQDFMAASRSKATLRAYQSDWRDFEKWCERHCLIMLPADARTVAAYLSSLATGRPMKLATIRRRLATIAYAHRCAKYDSPADDPAVKATMAGIARTIGSVHSKKTALTAALVTKVVKAISADTVAGLLDRALLLLQFSAALRVSELVDLKVNDIARHSEGIVLTIKRSKTDQDGVGLEKAVPRGKRLRPVAALDAWISAARIAEGPLFRTVPAEKVSKSGISLRTVSRMIKRRCAAVGLDPALFASHSLRSGFILKPPP
jgi:site-specific recombinase XerD